MLEKCQSYLKLRMPMYMSDAKTIFYAADIMGTQGVVSIASCLP